MQKIRFGMVGGGPGAFIGEVHRMAARLDNQYELVCGAFSSSAEKSKNFGVSIGLEESRSYASFQEMIQSEAALPVDERMEVLVIATPNHVHFEPAKLALANGMHVLSDKPATLNLEEALALEKLVAESGLLYGLTHNYTGYPMVKEARSLVKRGVLGEIRKVIAEYPQGWLSTKLEDTGHKQASWRADPSKSGQGGALGDIGTHAHNLTEYITGLKISSLFADVSSIVEGRALDDDANILVHLENGARGIIYCSQISLGEENPLSIRVYGSEASIEWKQMEPNTLKLKFADKPMQILRTGHPYLSEEASAAYRIPPGHPEGFIEAFANLYTQFAGAVNECKSNGSVDLSKYDFPGIEEAVRGMKFIRKAIESGESDQQWVTFE